MKTPSIHCLTPTRDRGRPGPGASQIRSHVRTADTHGRTGSRAEKVGAPARGAETVNRGTGNLAPEGHGAAVGFLGSFQFAGRASLGIGKSRSRALPRGGDKAGTRLQRLDQHCIDERVGAL